MGNDAATKEAETLSEVVDGRPAAVGLERNEAARARMTPVASRTGNAVAVVAGAPVLVDFLEKEQINI